MRRERLMIFVVFGSTPGHLHKCLEISGRGSLIVYSGIMC